MLLQSHHRQGGSEPGRADDHAVVGGQPRREGDDLMRRYPCVLGKPSVMANADVVGMCNDLGAGDQVTGIFEQYADQVHTRDDRRNASHLACWCRRKPVFVIDAGERDGDRDALGKVVRRHLDNATTDRLTIRDGLKRSK